MVTGLGQDCGPHCGQTINVMIIPHAFGLTIRLSEMLTLAQAVLKLSTSLYIYAP